VKAIVLTFDDHLPVARLVVTAYGKLWPDHPFRFRIPYNGDRPPAWSEAEGKIDWIHSPRPIKATMTRLLEGVPDEDWVYFCMDDKVPLEINRSAARRIHRFVLGLDQADISTVQVTRNNGVNRYIDFASWRFRPRRGLYFEKVDYHNFYQHQFVRARLLKRVFQSDEVAEDFTLKKGCDVDRLLGMSPFARKRTLPGERAFVPFRNAMLLAESFMAGRVTPACARALRLHGLPPLTEMPTTTQDWILDPEDSLRHTLGTIYRRLRPRSPKSAS
jgi:hypothetical protein